VNGPFTFLDSRAVNWQLDAVDTIWNAAVNTPWWVYLLFIYLMFVGYKASKGGVVSLTKLIILPAIFLAMSVETLVFSFKITPLSVIAWILSLLLGTVLGWFLICRQEMRVDKEKKLFDLPGTWSTGIVILLIFIVKFYFGYALSADPEVKINTFFEVSMLFFSGLFSGSFVGKLLNYLYRLKTSAHTSLELPKKK
jgi:Family of unknown function (DUF6622)